MMKPPEVFSDLPSALPQTPERDLWRAVLFGALHDYYDHPDEGVAERAYCWLTSPSEEPQSMHWVCVQLGLDFGYLMRLLTKNRRDPGKSVRQRRHRRVDRFTWRTSEGGIAA